MPGPDPDVHFVHISLVAWRLQLLDKRRFEVTERVMVVYRKVAQAIGVLRDSSSVSKLSPRQPDGSTPEKTAGRAEQLNGLPFRFKRRPRANTPNRTASESPELTRRSR